MYENIIGELLRQCPASEFLNESVAYACRPVALRALPNERKMICIIGPKRRTTDRPLDYTFHR